MCHCFAVRQAARTVSQLYDQHLAGAGLRATQFSILMKLQGYGPLQINNLATRMHLDRSTLGRNILPLQREGLVEVVEAEGDRRAASDRDLLELPAREEAEIAAVRRPEWPQHDAFGSRQWLGLGGRQRAQPHARDTERIGGGVGEDTAVG